MPSFLPRTVLRRSRWVKTRHFLFLMVTEAGSRFDMETGSGVFHLEDELHSSYPPMLRFVCAPQP